MDELLVEVEALYPGYTDTLQQIVYDGQVLFARDLTAAAAAWQ